MSARFDHIKSDHMAMSIYFPNDHKNVKKAIR
jgi:hypothetical protein